MANLVSDIRRAVSAVIDGLARTGVATIVVGDRLADLLGNVPQCTGRQRNALQAVARRGHMGGTEKRVVASLTFHERGALGALHN